MRYKEITEAVTSQGFKFGFEFECIGPLNFDIDYITTPITLTQDKDDSIIVDDNDEGTEKGFEFISPPLVLNPKNIISSKETILALLKQGFRTNGTCGFHIHYSFQNMNYGDICWFLLGLSLNGDLQSQFSNFYDIEFFNETYADLKFLQEIPDAVSAGDTDKIAKLFSTYKFRIIRIHPQGTIEWRGPRDFMNSGEISKISDFFLRLYRCADIIHKLSTRDSYEIGGKILKKNSFVSMLNSSDASSTGSFLKNGNSVDPSMDMNDVEQLYKKYPWLKTISFKKISMQDTSTGLVFHKGSITGGQVKECMINSIEVSNAHLDGTMLINAMVTSCKAVNIQAQGCGFEKCRISNSTLIQCEYERSTIANSTVDGQKVENEKITD